MFRAAKDAIEQASLRYFEYMEKEVGESPQTIPLHLFHIFLRFVLSEADMLLSVESLYRARNGDYPECTWYAYARINQGYPPRLK